MQSVMTRRLMPIFLMVVVAGLAAGCDLFGGDEVFDIPIETSTDFDTNVDIGSVTGDAAGQQAPARQEFNVDLPAIPLDFTTVNEELNKNKNKLREVSVTFIRVTPTNNTVTGNLPPIDLYIGSKDGGGSDGVKVATIPPIPPGSNEPFNATIDTTGMQNAQGFITSLAFSIQPRANLVVEQGETVPGGAADLNIEVGLRAVVNPTK